MSDELVVDGFSADPEPVPDSMILARASADWWGRQFRHVGIFGGLLSGGMAAMIIQALPVLSGLAIFFSIALGTAMGFGLIAFYLALSIGVSWLRQRTRRATLASGAPLSRGQVRTPLSVAQVWDAINPYLDTLGERIPGADPSSVMVTRMRSLLGWQLHVDVRPSADEPGLTVVTVLGAGGDLNPISLDERPHSAANALLAHVPGAILPGDDTPPELFIPGQWAL